MLYSSGSDDSTLNTKSIYKNLVRPGLPSLDTMSPTIIHLLDYLKWKRVALMISHTSFCNSVSQSIERMVNERSDLKVTDKIIVNSYEKEKEMEVYLKRIAVGARIVICCFSTEQIGIMMYTAAKLKMTAKDYAFIYYSGVPTSFTTKPWGDSIENKKYFAPLIHITLSSLAGSRIQTFLRDDVPIETAKAPFFSPIYLNNNWTAGVEAIFVYETTYFLCNVMNETIQANKSVRDIDWMMEKSKSRYIRSKFGRIEVDSKADRLPDYWVWHFDGDKNEYTPWLEVILTGRSGNGSEITVYSETNWQTETGLPPPDVPKCGFSNEFCPSPPTDNNALYISIGVACLVLILVSIAISIYFRRKKLEADIYQMIWKINVEDVELINKGAFSAVNLSAKSIHSNSSQPSNASVKSVGQIYSRLALYKGTTVSVRIFPLENATINLTRERLRELKEMKEMNHENVNPFIGLSLEPPKAHILWMYCSRGSLQDILENDDLTLDSSFKRSLIKDLISGMNFLHSSILKYHGSLTSGCCLIDSRWVLRIGSYGMYQLRNLQFQSNLKKEGVAEYQIYKKLLWCAPEILRSQPLTIQDGTLPIGNQEGDVYSFAMVLSEILFRGLPYFNTFLSPKELITRVKNGEKPPLRPTKPEDLKLDEDDDKYIELMKECWNENPHDRPNFEKITKSVRKINIGKDSNIMDTMITKLEKYANNLEEIVENRTKMLIEEKKKTDSLLYRMLPPMVAEKLKSGCAVEAEIFDLVTIFFSDVVGFTSLSSQSSPMQVVDLLNDLYTLFDDILSLYDVYKVETIGDAYVVVSGAPRRNGMKHVIEIADVALHLSKSVGSFQVRHKPDLTIHLRIGIHTGPCAAGVVGQTMPRYCLFGDTVITANIMESNGKPSKVHLSPFTKDALEKVAGGGYKIEERGSIPIKGKGEMTTYWLLQKIDEQGNEPKKKEI
ncbi:DgyrCDS12962 [Dimorphilus gyrociliatus]|uniref:guanylate cyclase n=1 Tax=Dimorphilus gyrociliatus TaxID=2664684 RepID=A0A7I8W9B3_9ANNE|nr:DgyrCDS12962 [Dimorphilus gyrociliatus]